MRALQAATSDGGYVSRNACSGVFREIQPKSSASRLLRIDSGQTIVSMHSRCILLLLAVALGPAACLRPLDQLFSLVRPSTDATGGTGAVDEKPWFCHDLDCPKYSVRTGWLPECSKRDVPACYPLAELTAMVCRSSTRLPTTSFARMTRVSCQRASRLQHAIVLASRLTSGVFTPRTRRP